MTFEIPVVIICYNNGWLVERTIEQLASRVSDFIVIDNASTSARTADALSGIAKSGVRVWREDVPGGYPQYSFYRRVRDLPKFFAVTDPDLEYRSDLPPDFLRQLADLAVECGAKAGLALDLSDADSFVLGGGHAGGRGIVEGEEAFWKYRRPHPTLEVYDGAIDTTFAVYMNTGRAAANISEHTRAVRVAGSFTCKHLPWYRSFWLDTDIDVLMDAYRDNGTSGARSPLSRVGLAFREVIDREAGR